MCGSHMLRPLQHAYRPTFFPLARSRPLQGLQDGESKSHQRQEEELFPRYSTRGLANQAQRKVSFKVLTCIRIHISIFIAILMIPCLSSKFFSFT